MKNLKAELHCLRWTLRYMGIWFLVWSGMALAINESVVDLFVKNTDTPILLLEGYGKQHLWLFTVTILVIVLTITFAIVAFIFQAKEKHKLKNTKNIIEYYSIAETCHLGLIIILLFASFVWIPIFMLDDMELMERYTQIQEDLAVAKEDSLKSDLVFLHSDSSMVNFVPLGSRYADTAVCYHVAGVNASRKHLPAWEEIYVPDCLHFNMDTEHAYNEWKSIEWNEYHAVIYRITYTPNLHLVVSIEVESQGR